jgi:hypothetical protein
LEIGICILFFPFLFIGLSQSYVYDRGVCGLTWIDSYFFYFFFKLNFFFYFCLSTLSCSIIEFHDFIYFAFKHGHFGIMTKSKILHIDLGGLGSSFFWHFLNYIYIFLNFHALTLLIELQLFSFYVFLCGTIMFSFDLLRTRL